MDSNLDFERYYKIMDQEQVIKKKYSTKQRLLNVISKVPNKNYFEFAQNLILSLIFTSAKFSESLSSEKQTIIAETHSTSEINLCSYQEFFAAAYNYLVQINALTMDLREIVKLEKQMNNWVEVTCLTSKWLANVQIPDGITVYDFVGPFMSTRFNYYVIDELTIDELVVVRKCLEIIIPSGEKLTDIHLYVAKLLAKIFESLEATDLRTMMIDSLTIYPLIEHFFNDEIVMNGNEFLFGHGTCSINEAATF